MTREGRGGGGGGAAAEGGPPGHLTCTELGVPRLSSLISFLIAKRLDRRRPLDSTDTQMQKFSPLQYHKWYSIESKGNTRVFITLGIVEHLHHVRLQLVQLLVALVHRSVSILWVEETPQSALQRQKLL